MTYIEVVNWRQYQHYRDRNPPWIKLHREMLNGHTWITLDDASRVLAIAIMLLAAENDNRIPNDPEYIKRRAYLHKPPDISKLISCNFIRLTGNDGDLLADASAAQANARPETETEEEEEADRRALVDEWNRLPQSVSKVESLGKDRLAKIKTRLSDKHFRENWRKALGMIPNCPFLLGDKGWRITFDWFVANGTNYTKILEGQYSTSKPEQPKRYELPNLADLENG